MSARSPPCVPVGAVSPIREQIIHLKSPVIFSMLLRAIIFSVWLLISSPSAPRMSQFGTYNKPKIFELLLWYQHFQMLELTNKPNLLLNFLCNTYQQADRFTKDQYQQDGKKLFWPGCRLRFGLEREEFIRAWVQHDHDSKPSQVLI